MITFFITLAIVTSIFTLILLKLLSNSEPVFSHKSKIVGNWKEGGWQIAIAFFGLAIAISIGITKVILWFNFLENAVS